MRWGSRRRRIAVGIADTPKRLDDETELTDVASNEGVILYHYRLVNLDADRVNVEAIKSLQPQVAKGACANADLRRLIDGGVSLRYSYADRNGAHLVWLDVNKFDCDGSLIKLQ